MKTELTWNYLQSIQPDPLPRFAAMSEEAWASQWQSSVKAATCYEDFPEPFVIPAHVWEERLVANWARLVEYDRLTAEREQSKETA